jgi:hypothetical protein
VVKRLARIAALLEDDWQSPDRALELHMAVQLHRLRTKSDLPRGSGERSPVVEHGREINVFVPARVIPGRRRPVQKSLLVVFSAPPAMITAQMRAATTLTATTHTPCLEAGLSKRMARMSPRMNPIGGMETAMMYASTTNR